ncbi:hypothetical protein pb186bvf_016856 [Paramecium bursaria]
MGNQWIKDYDIDKKPFSSGGVGNIWKIHNAKKQKEEFSVFIFDKRCLDKVIKNDKEKEQIFITLRKEAQRLSTLKHPYILSLQEPPAEDQKRLVCVTEKVKGSLAHMIQNDQLGLLSILDIKVSLRQIIEAISFLHTETKLIHLNISPENIYITKDGKWKLSGFLHSIQNTQSTLQQLYLDLNNKPYDNLVTLRPNLSFLAPEVAAKNSQASFKSDIFSFGLVLAGLLRYLSQGIKDLGIFEIQSIQQYDSSYDYLISFIQKSQFFVTLTQNVQELILNMLKPEPQRLGIMDVYHSEFFMDPLARLIHQLRQIKLQDPESQLTLLKSVAQNIFKFETIVILKDIIPLIFPYIQDPKLMNPIVFVAIDISKIQDPQIEKMYYNEIWKPLKMITQLTSMPAQSLYALVQNIPRFIEFKIPMNEIMTHLVPLYIKCLESNVSKLQQISLSSTKCLIEKLEYQYTKSQVLSIKLFKILPRLLVIKDTLHIFDIVSLFDSVLPTLGKMREGKKIKKEQAELLLDIYTEVSPKLSFEQVVNQLIPQMMPFIIELQIGVDLIQKYSNLIRDLIENITKEKVRQCQEIQNANQQVQGQNQQQNNIQEQQDQKQINFNPSDEQVVQGFIINHNDLFNNGQGQIINHNDLFNNQGQLQNHAQGINSLYTLPIMNPQYSQQVPLTQQIQQFEIPSQGGFLQQNTQYQQQPPSNINYQQPSFQQDQNIIPQQYVNLQSVQQQNRQSISQNNNFTICLTVNILLRQQMIDRKMSQNIQQGKDNDIFDFGHIVVGQPLIQQPLKVIDPFKQNKDPFEGWEQFEQSK